MELQLPYKFTLRDEEALAFAERQQHLQKEKDLNGEDIKGILRKIFEVNGLLVKTERTLGGGRYKPFDMAVGNKETYEVTGLEIKGDTDTFTRLPDQIIEYNTAFDDVYLVLHKKEIPKWMPSTIGIIRVFEDGNALIEHPNTSHTYFDIGSTYDWETILNMNNISLSGKKAIEMMQMLEKVRKNLLFNRMFAVYDGFGSYRYEQFYPLANEQKKLVMRMDIQGEMKVLLKEFKELEKRMELIKSALALSRGEDGQNSN